MKRNAIFGAIAALVIAGLMISTGSMAAVQKSTTSIKSADVSDVNNKPLDKETILSRIDDPNFLNSLQKVGSVEKAQNFATKKSMQISAQREQKVTMPAEQLTSANAVQQSGSRGVEIALAKQPALAYDGGLNGVLGYTWDYTNISFPAENEKAVIWQGTNDSFANWGFGLYYVYTTSRKPIPFTYPSVHYKGIDLQTGLPYFVGSVVPPATPIGNSGWACLLEVIGDPGLNTSYSLSTWNWSASALQARNSKMTEVAYANIPDYEWGYGFLSEVMTTPYAGYQCTDGCMVQFPFNNSGWNTISWFGGLNYSQGTDAIVDHAAKFYVPNYVNQNWMPSKPKPADNIVEYMAYAAYDPKNESTSAKHYLFVRQFDLDPIYKGRIADPAQYYVGYDSNAGWELTDNTLSIERPSVDAYNSNLIVATEIKNLAGQNTSLYVWQTPTGNASYLDIVAGWTPLTATLKITSPDVCHIEGDRFVLLCIAKDGTADAEVWIALTYDGGKTWTDLYTIVSDEKVVNEYRGVDIAEKGSYFAWAYDTSVPPYHTSTSIHYSPLTAQYTGYVCKIAIPGIPVPGAEVLAYNLDPTYGGYIGSTYSNDAGVFSMPLVPGFDVWANVTSPITMRFIALDGTNYIKINEYVITDIQAVNDLGNFLLNIHYRDLKTFPWYFADTNEMSGAAVAQMMLNYLTWNSTLSYQPPMTFPDQQVLYDDLRNGNQYINANDMAAGLNAKIRPVDPNFAYFFAAYGNTLAADTLKDICIWVDYPVDYYNNLRLIPVPQQGFPNHVPVATPVMSGTYSHWVAVRGIHTDQPCWPPASIVNLNVYGLWINDPMEMGNGLGRTYVPIATWNSVYFKPITVVGDAFNGKYVSVTDPFVGGTEIPDDINIVCQPSPVASTYQPAIVKAGENVKATSMMKSAAIKNIAAAARELVDNVLKNDADQQLVTAFAHTTLSSVTKENGNYVVSFVGETNFNVVLKNGVLVKFTYA